MLSTDSFLPNGSASEVGAYEEKARKWNLWVTALLTLILCLPLPFAHFETWPGLATISEHIITPWSRFRLCYEAYPEGERVEDVYSFTWKGQLRNGDGSDPQFLHPDSLGPVILKWQNGPEIVLREVYQKGELIRVETNWQPMIVWPFKMVWRIREHFRVPERN